MFELSIAFKYLTPRWRQLSVSIISLISILVIALVVWLIVVFFSVTAGLERNWVDRLIALTAPVRILPTETYYNSYYHNIDRISAASGYTQKTLGEKLQAPVSDPYDPSSDEEVPSTWLAADRNEKGALKDPVKEAFAAIGSLNDIPGIAARDYEMTLGNLRLNLIRQPDSGRGLYEQASLSQATYLGSFDPDNRALQGALLPLSMEDLSHLLAMSAIASDSTKEEGAPLVSFSSDQFKDRLKTFFSGVTIRQLEIPLHGWMLPKALWPDSARWRAAALVKGERVIRILIPPQPKALDELASSLSEGGYQVIKGTLDIREGQAHLALPGKEPQLTRAPLVAMGALVVEAALDPASLETAERPEELQFHVKFNLQGTALQGKTTYGNLAIHRADVHSSPLWVSRSQEKLELPVDSLLGSGILLPRGFKDAGVLVGDRGSLVYVIPSASSLQEQRLPVFVAGFYDRRYYSDRWQICDCPARGHKCDSCRL